jgi:hypothetical protein
MIDRPVGLVVPRGKFGLLEVHCRTSYKMAHKFLFSEHKGALTHPGAELQ